MRVDKIDGDLGRFVRRRILGGKNVEVMRGILIFLTKIGDDEGATVVARIIDRETKMRKMLGMKETVSGGSKFKQT